MLSKNYKSILIIRLSAIGDVVFTNPFLHAMRRAYPEARITWLCEPAIKSLLEADVAIDNVITWPKQDWRGYIKQGQFIRLFKAWRKLRAELRALDADLAIDLQGLLKSGIWAWFSGARERIGLGSREGSQRLMTRVVAKGGKPENISSEYIFLAEQLNLPVDLEGLRLSIDKKSHQEAEQIITSRELSNQIAVVLPFTTRPQKHWFDDSWQSLVIDLQHDGFDVVMLGGPGDKNMAQAIGRDQPSLHNLVGETSLLTAAAIISRASIVIGVDTGLTHMGHALLRPTISLFGSTCPYLDPINPAGRVIYHKLWCSPCRRRPLCNNEFSCMQLITVSEVMATVKQIALRSA
jgi:heptosyltransferase I